MTIQTKLSPDDEAWVMRENKACQVTVKEIRIIITADRLFAGLPIMYTVYENNGGYLEPDIFPTKEELLQSL